MIKAINLRKYFGSIKALDNLTVEIPEGVNLIVGPNGGGKSTFLKIAAGIYRPTGGKIRVLGEDPWKNGEIKKYIGVSFDPQGFPLWRQEESGWSSLQSTEEEVWRMLRSF
jgi:ABC-2 type transport system ATP-binding protein